MSQNQNSKLYDLEERTFQFAKKTTFYLKDLPKTISNLEYSKQVIDFQVQLGPIILRPMRL